MCSSLNNIFSPMIKIKSRKIEIVRDSRIVKLTFTISLASIFFVGTLVQTISCFEGSLPDVPENARFRLNSTILKGVSVDYSKNFNLEKERILKRVYSFKQFRRTRTFSRFIGANLPKYFLYLQSQSSFCSCSYRETHYNSSIFLKNLSIRC